MAKDRTIIIRASSAEKEHLILNATKAGMKLSEYLIAKGLDIPLFKIPANNAYDETSKTLISGWKQRAKPGELLKE